MDKHADTIGLIIACFFWLLVVCFIVFLAIGWVMNIVKLMWIINDPITGMMILRAVGIFFSPLGAIIGWL